MKNFLSFNQRNNVRGSVLIMAIIMGSGMLLVAVEVSMYVASTIQQARSIDRTLVAQYAAESAIENVLHQVRKEGRETLRPDSETSSALYSVDARDARWSFMTGSAVDPMKFSPTVQKITTSLLGEQRSIDIHLWTENATGFSPLPADMTTMSISWARSECGPNEVPWIETTGLTLEIPGTSLQWNDLSNITKDFQRPADGEQKISVDLAKLVSDGGLSGKGLSLRVTAFFCSIHNVEILFPKAGDASTLVAIPNYYLIHPTATFGDVQKDLQVIMPKYTGATGVFDYLLFSEEKIDKSEQ